MESSVSRVAQYVVQQRLTACTAESCTAGLIASLLGAIDGCGDWFEGGFVAYSPEAKAKLLGVSKGTIDAHGLTSEQVAQEMAVGALKYGTACVALANTGLAGPPPAGDDLLPGTQCFAWAFGDDNGTRVYSETRVFRGNRNQIRMAAAMFAIDRLPVYHRQFCTLSC